jgi:hypothetical protein
MADLGARLVLAGLVTPELLAEVRRSAPPHEGALVAALVERGVPDDAIANELVAAGLGPRMEPSDLAGAPADVLARMSPRMAHQLLALPVRDTAAGLVVAMAAPSDAHAVAEIRRALATDILPVAASLRDLSAALDRAYPREATRDTTRPAPSEPVGFGGSTRGADREEARAPLGPRLRLDEEDGVVPLVRHKTVAPAPAPRKRLVTRSFERPSEVAAPAPTTPERPPAKSIIPREHDRWDLDDGPPTATWQPGATAAPPHAKVDSKALRTLPAPARPARPSPLGGTLAGLRASHSRDEVVRLACSAALTVSRVVVLLAVRKGLLQGWDGAGPGLSRDAVRNLWIPTSSASMFREVVRHGERFVGAYGTTAADGVFRAAVGSRGGRAVLQPIVVGDRVVAVLACDDVGFEQAGVERLEILARAVGDAFERLVRESRRR